MKTNWMLAGCAIVALGLTTLSAARAGERGAGNGPIQHILDNAKELNLTDDQKTKLQALVTDFKASHEGGGGMREKAKSNPELMETLKEMKAARESKDEAKLKELRAKLMADGMKAGAGKGEGGRGEFVQKLAQILNPDQMKKLKEMREAAGEGRGAGGAKNKTDTTPNDKSNKPDASKGVPNPFE